METEENIPQELKIHFSAIADRLWSGKASVIVGAGFSSNANPNNTSAKRFPTWKELGDIFYSKLYGVRPADKETDLNMIELAEEFESRFDRPALERLLIESIPDQSYSPSTLHHNLLRLPWNKVFTTNYDTLLERTQESKRGYNYSIVYHSTDIANAKPRKIVKLHGSFPSHRPFIITKKDYAEYPEKFEPFVTSVRNTLLEDTVCLIGFSGDDPNFLDWNGWLKNNLKGDAQKVYLVGVLNLNESKRKNYKESNIIPIDLAECLISASGKSFVGDLLTSEPEKNIDIIEQHKITLNIFFNYLSSFKKNDTSDINNDWPRNNKHFHFFPGENNLSKIPLILESWTPVRTEFPNWLIVPEDRREILKIYTEECDYFIMELPKTDAPNDIRFLYEYNWRIEKCLIPIDSDLIASYEQVI